MQVPYDLDIRDGRITLSFDAKDFGVKSISQVEIDDLDEEMASDLLSGNFHIAIGIGIIGRVTDLEDLTHG